MQHILDYKEGFSLSMVLHIILMILLGAGFHHYVKVSEPIKKGDPKALPSQAVMINEQEIHDIKEKIKNTQAQKERRKRQLDKKLADLQKAKSRQQTDINKLEKQKQLLEASNKKMQNTKAELAKIQKLKADAQESLAALKRQTQEAQKKAEEAKAKLDALAKKKLKTKPKKTPTPPTQGDGGHAITATERNRQTKLFYAAIKKYFHPREIDQNKKSVVRISFTIDGAVTAMQIKVTSGDPEFDRIITRAINKASPLPILDDIKDKLQKSGNTLELNMLGDLS